jgi:tungstate transport system ATP-binding protein
MFCECHGLTKRFGRRTVLDLEHLAIPEGQTTAVAGPNGSGKTTLLEIVALLSRPDEGELRLWGSPARFGDLALRRSVVMVMHPGYVFRGSVMRNVLFGLRALGVPRAEARRRADEALGLVGLSVAADRGAKALSAGERQRMNLARAIALRPRARLLDEPTANVDSECIHVVRDVLLRLREQDGTTIVHTSPAGNDLAEITQQTIELRDGRIRGEGLL